MVQAAQTSTRAAAPWDSIHGLRGSNFGELADEALSLTQTINELKDSLEGVKAQILEHMVRSQQQSVQAGALRVAYVAGKAPSRKLDEQLLLKNGVQLSVIERSYVEGKPGKPFVMLTTKVEAESETA